MTDKEWQDVQEALWAFKNKVKDNPEICFVGAMVNMKKRMAVNWVNANKAIDIAVAVMSLVDTILQRFDERDSHAFKASIMGIFKTHEKAPSAGQC